MNDDMEELFRRAGEEYPLNTDGADWNKVMQRLHHDEDDLPEGNKKEKDYRFLLLLLLLPIGFVVGKYFGNGHDKGNFEKANKALIVNATPSDKTAPVVSSSKTEATSGGHENTASAISHSPVEDGIKSEGNDAAGRFQADKKSEVVKAGITDKNESTAAKKLAGSSLDKVPVSEERFAGSVTDLHSSGASTGKGNETNDVKNNVAGKNSAEVGGGSNSVHSATETTSQVAGSVNQKAELQPADDKKPADDEKNVINDKKSGINKSGSNKKHQAFKRNLYYSFVAGPDLSTIKLENTGKVGYSLGLLLGYQASRKISIEGGVLWDRKNYNTTGEYLDTSRLQLPLHSIVSKVDGYCDMIEVPVNVKYTFNTKQHHSWFVSAGLSSYFMKNENYNLTYKQYSMAYEKDYGYKNSSKDWFSIMNLSAGYQKSAGKFTSISIAPYIKLPLRGVGIGKLPITSTGIYVSLSRTIH